VLAKLSPEGEVSDPERALYGVTHLAISGDSEGATLDQFIPEGDCPPVEHALTVLEAPAARRWPRPGADYAALLWREFITAPLT